MKKTILFLSVTTLLLSSCSGPTGVAQFSWLEGTWKGKDINILFTESWTKASDDLFSCNSIAIQGEDTVYKEHSKIQVIGDVPYYIINVPEFSNEPVLFKLTATTEKGATFENKEHDFPQTIIYQMEFDSLHVVLDGIKEGKKAREEIYYHKKK